MENNDTPQHLRAPRTATASNPEPQQTTPPPFVLIPPGGYAKALVLRVTRNQADVLIEHLPEWGASNWPPAAAQMLSNALRDVIESTNRHPAAGARLALAWEPAAVLGETIAAALAADLPKDERDMAQRVQVKFEKAVRERAARIK